jgi:hypothetical protein
MMRRTLYTAVGVVATLALFVAPAAATSEPVTKMTLLLDAQSVPAGSSVSGNVLVVSGPGDHAVPYPNASVTISVDGIVTGSVTTNASGLALVSAPATAEGLHHLRVSVGGDADHKKAHDQVMFTVTADGGNTTSSPPPDPTTTSPPPDPTTTTAPPDPTTTTTTPPPPGSPDAPIIDLLESPLPGYVYLQWIAPADNGSPILNYNIYRGLSSNGETLLRSRNAQFDFVDDFDVVSGQTYFYVVTAVTANGESAWSNEVSVTAL